MRWSFRGETAAVILVGGESRRMGRDKTKVKLDGESLLARTRGRLEGQCARLALSVRDVGADFSGEELVPDVDAGEGGGPLLGVLAALRWAGGLSGVSCLLTSPVDTPLLPDDLAARLYGDMRQQGRLSAVAVSADRTHGLSALYDLRVIPEAEKIVLGEGERMLNAFHRQLGSARTVFSTEGGDPFLNVNEPNDLDRAATAIAASSPTE